MSDYIFATPSQCMQAAKVRFSNPTTGIQKSYLATYFSLVENLKRTILGEGEQTTASWECLPPKTKINFTLNT